MTSMDLAVVTQDETALARLDRHAVTELLERGKSWLQQALDRDIEIGELVNYRGEAAVLRELVMQKELGKDAELAATELVRRAERAIGLSVRRGQEQGTIGSREHPTDGGPKRDYVKADGTMVHAGTDQVRDTNRISPRVAAGNLSKSVLDQHYDLVDDVSDQQFEQAVDQAKAEGSLSRANLIRKARKQPALSNKRPEVLRKTRRFDSRTVVSKTVAAAADVITHSLLAEVDFAELETEELEEWISSLNNSIRALRSLTSQLSKELTHRER